MLSRQRSAEFDANRRKSSASVGGPDRNSVAPVEIPPPRSVSPGERTVEHHHNYFYKDGSIVLQVETTIFRLHKSLLSVQSTFFRELFADLDRPAERLEDALGVALPLYVLSIKGLHVADFEHLLEIMENPLLISRSLEPPSLDFVSSVVLAAHLLKFDVIHAWAAAELHGYWPSDIHSVGKRPDDWLLCVEYASAALDLSRDANVPKIYKGTFYELLRQENFGQDSVPLIGSADYNLLTRARQLCATIWMDTISKPLPRSKKCKDDEKASGEKSTCVARRNDTLYHKWGCIVENMKLRDKWMDPIAAFEALRTAELLREERGGLCGSCCGSWKSVWEEKVSESWTRLDEVLDGA